MRSRPRSRPAPRRRRWAGRRPAPLVRLRGPGEAVAAVPFLLGFEPVASLVVVGLTGARCAPVLRLDLPETAADEESLAALAAELMGGRGLHEALVLVYADEPPGADPLAPLPRQHLLAAVEAELERVDVPVRDAVVVRAGRWYSVHCADPECCPPEGRVVAEDLRDGAQLALLALCGPPLADRAELVASVAPQPGPGAEAAVGGLVAELAEAPVLSLVVQLEEALAHASALVADGRELEPATLVLLAALVQRTAVRDEAVMGVDEDDLEASVLLWRQVFRATADRWLPQVGGVLASLAWESGQGPLGRVVCELVLAVDPQHALTQLTRDLLDQGVAPPGVRG